MVMFPQLKLPQIQKIMMEFEKQSEMMDMKEEMMNDAIDDAMGDEEDEDARLEMIPLLPLFPHNSWMFFQTKPFQNKRRGEKNHHCVTQTQFDENNSKDQSMKLTEIL